MTDPKAAEVADTVDPSPLEVTDSVESLYLREPPPMPISKAEFAGSNPTSPPSTITADHAMTTSTPVVAPTPTSTPTQTIEVIAPAPVPVPVPGPAPEPITKPINPPNKIPNTTTTTKTKSKPKATDHLSPNDLETANNEIASLLLSNKITNAESSKLQNILRENATLKDKIAKLKLLLSRSAKASKETKNDLETHRRLLDMAQQEIQRLNARLENMANRPTHMDLLADFETNFDKAVLSIGAAEGGGGGNGTQSGGEATTSQANGVGGGEVGNADGEDVVSSMLLTELAQAKERSEYLERMNDDLSERADKLAKRNEQLESEKESVNLKMSNLQLELRMAKMETENASRVMREKAASLGEMQMEIDLVTRSAMDANVRAAEGMEFAKGVKSDKAHVQELEAKVTALQEWAVASASAKEIIVEQNRNLQERLKKLTASRGEGDASVGKEKASSNVQAPTLAGGFEGGRGGDKWNSSIERLLWNKTSSLVVGAGMSQWHVIELGECHLQDNETVLLRWQFDITPSNNSTVFAILKGRIEDKRDIRDADAVLKERLVQSGGGGEVQGAFAVKNACTLVWSNAHSWIRPTGIKYTVEAFAVM